MSDKTPRRTVRIDDELWDGAKEAAAARGDNLSGIIRASLAQYIAGDAQ